MKKLPSKTGYFCKTAEILSSALTAPPSLPKTNKGTRFILVFIVLGIYNFDAADELQP